MSTSRVERFEKLVFSLSQEIGDMTPDEHKSALEEMKVRSVNYGISSWRRRIYKELASLLRRTM